MCEYCFTFTFALKKHVQHFLAKCNILHGIDFPCLMERSLKSYITLHIMKEALLSSPKGIPGRVFGFKGDIFESNAYIFGTFLTILGQFISSGELQK